MIWNLTSFRILFLLSGLMLAAAWMHGCDGGDTFKPALAFTMSPRPL